MITKRILIRDPEEPSARRALAEAGEIIRDGGLVAFPTETVYGLGGDGLNPLAARKIYAAKGRPSDNPLILHIAEKTELHALIRRMPAGAERLMEAFWPGPMTLIFEKSDAVPAETTGGLSTVAVRMPSHPTARALIRASGRPIAAPSANLSGRPSPTTAGHVWEDMNGRIEMILDSGAALIGLESTIIDLTGETPLILRPGYISREAVARVLGSCEFDPAVTGKPDPSIRPKAPGMKYRHYAPKAELTIFRGEAGAVTAEILRLACAARDAGQNPGVLCTEETKDRYLAESGLTVRCIGTRGREETIAHNLFACLREFDEEKTDVIYSESFEGGELGAAIMNRLVKAAGYRIRFV